MANEWRGFLVAFVLTAAGALLAAAAVIALVDPLAISPVRVMSDEILPQTNRRYIVPAIVRSGRYDSFIVGTSTSHTLDPREMARVLPGRFANVSLLGSSPYEQSRLVALIGGQATRAPGRIVWGLDSNWCGATDASLRAGPEVLPEWLYDQNRWNDLAHAFNWSALDLARRKLQQSLRLQRDRLRADGYHNMLPPDGTFDLAKARKLIYGSSPPREIPRQAPPTGNGAPPSSGALPPGAAMLREALASLPENVGVVLVLMPSHAVVIPPPKSDEAQSLHRCKAALAAAAAAQGAWLLDAMWHSAWTVKDENYWDHTHFRDHVAGALVRSIGAAVREGAQAPAAELTVMVRGRTKGP